MKTKVGKQYFVGKLTVPGRTPLPVPVSPVARTQKDIQSLLLSPLKHLCIGSDGDVVLPSMNSLPAHVNSTVRSCFESLEQEFPQKAQRLGPAPAPASGGHSSLGPLAPAWDVVGHRGRRVPFGACPRT